MLAFTAPALLPSSLALRPRALTRSRPRGVAVRRVPCAKLDALLFDCDGVLADTERDGHRVAFNLAFHERGIADAWDEALYGILLETGGGKERMTARWDAAGWPAGFEDGGADRVELVKALHARKTEVFMELVKDGGVPLREGVARLVEEAREAGVVVAVCSTSNEKAVAEIVGLLGEEAMGEIRIFAGDMVPKKKPHPAIYNMAAEELGLDPKNVCVIEDSYIGLSAAKAAGMTCLVTKSSYTQDEDFAAADRVVSSLDDPRVTLADLTTMAASNN